MEWKSRGNNEDAYQARLISHEAKTNVEYGEKTWTTAQTVRDLMQNHLDAETARYYKKISSLIFDEEQLEKQGDDAMEKISDFLYMSYMFANHAKDMTPEARAISEKHLQKISAELPLKEGIVKDGVFDVALFMEQAKESSMQIPRVSYEITNTETNKPLGWIPYETLRDEPLYQESFLGRKIYRIDGMKIVDRGPGYDSQLSALYISSKTGKKHLRGKFGEGAKMSELHLLRHGAQMKMRSQYSFQSNEGERKRLWQARAKLVNGKLVSEGVEIEKNEIEETGSTTIISLQKANKDFRQKMLENIDPRYDGLSRNILEFNSEEFAYPMPITEKNLAGINMISKSDVQYVQGLRVELATESFGYGNPWYSYNILDSSIIGGRDRNEIKDDIISRIRSFWENNDNPELIKRLVRDVIGDESKGGKRGAPELIYFESILSRDVKNKEDEKNIIAERIQKIIDETMIAELVLEENVPTLILSGKDYDDKERGWGKYINYAEECGRYRIEIIAGDVSSYSISEFAKRIPGNYKVVSLKEIRSEFSSKEMDRPKNEFVEGGKERAIRQVFSSAVQSLNSVITVSGIPLQNFSMSFNSNENGEDEYGDIYMTERKAMRIKGNNLIIDPYEIIDPGEGYDEQALLQRQIELCLLSAYGDKTAMDKQDNYDDYNDDFDDDNQNDSRDAYFDEEFSVSDVEYLKKSQYFIDSLITRLIPEDSPLLRSIPSSFNYTKNTEVVIRLLEALSDNIETRTNKKKLAYELYRKTLSSNLSFAEARHILQDNAYFDQNRAKRVLMDRVFVSDNSLHFYNKGINDWQELKLSKENKIFEWKGNAVYELTDGRFFVAATMAEGAVLSRGEGKKKEYIINDGNNFLKIGEYEVKFDDYSNNPRKIAVNPGGIVLFRNEYNKTTFDYIQEQLEAYQYFPKGSAEKGNNEIIEGVFATAIPIEYGKDEWDNPVRIFQDIIQNHVDASVGLGGVSLMLEVKRDENKIWITSDEMNVSDKIVGLKVSDNGDGYAPSEISTMGASSKKSPLFAGKYGEGQKMIAAAALRSGLDLEYQSVFENDGKKVGWRAQAVSEVRQVILDGKEVEKQLVAFDISALKNSSAVGSFSTLRMSEKASEKEIKQWSEWVSIIDPRKKDSYNNGGLARFVRQLRKPNSEREYKIGSISILLDEPGAVYENGLRINPNAESGRLMSFGYDVPEIVTTRERNSYDTARLAYYSRHIISHITNPLIIEEILRKSIAAKGEVTRDLKIGYSIGKDECATAVWAEVAQKIWPDFLVYSSEKLRTDLNFEFDEYGYPTQFYNEQEKQQSIEVAEKARYIQMNMMYVDRKKLLDVSSENYNIFATMLPTVEGFINKMEAEELPLPAETKKMLSKVVAESAKVFSGVIDDIENEYGADQMPYHIKKAKKEIRKWNDAEKIEQRDQSLAVIPIESTLFGQVKQEKVIFNEGLLLEKNGRELASTSLHEIAHIISGENDFTENFVSLLYDLTKHFALQAKTASV